jgi:Restriction endonuclease
MLDFSELSRDGQELELLARELLVRRGFEAHWSGRGADGGQDLICIERRDSFFAPDQKRWLIQCKHYAHSKRAVGLSDLDNVIDSCHQHQCSGYLLFTSTFPSSGVVQRLQAISANTRDSISATYWDATKIEQLLSTPRNWSLAQRFFPASANAHGWKIYATEYPNHWVVIFRGYYFHLCNRIGSSGEYHLETISRRISEIEAISLPDSHVIRIRSVYYDDKNGVYNWYLDYMYPYDQEPSLGTAEIAHRLGSDDVLDGQMYFFDVVARSYIKSSDHFDLDHYDYYSSFPIFGYGLRRPMDHKADCEFRNSELQVREQLRMQKEDAFRELSDTLKRVPFFEVLNARNARIEDLKGFGLNRNWRELIGSLQIDSDNFFSAWFLIKTPKPGMLFDLLNYFPQKVERHFRIVSPFIFLPSTDDGRRSVKSAEADGSLFELKLSIHPCCIADELSGRRLLNSYFSDISEAIKSFLDHRA